MKRGLLIFLLFVLNKSFAQVAPGPLREKYVLVIHGGAGTILKSQMTPEKEKAYRASIDRALQIGNEILKDGGSALDAVEACVRSLEDDPLFNAGKGSVFTNEGKNEMDAAIMDGKTLAAGSVAGVTVIKNPISAARAVMEKSNHVMLTGKGAEQFARQQGLTIVDPSYFFTEERWKSLQKAKEQDSIVAANHARIDAIKYKIDSMKRELGLYALQQEKEANMIDSMSRLIKKAGFAQVESTKKTIDSLLQMKERRREQLDKMRDRILADTATGNINMAEYKDYKYGTVGAVALDRYGNLAAATSTGGMTNKKFGRVGDAPIIGAGTYANNATAAMSGTGWGEFYIRLVMAKSISDMMEFGKRKLKDAADEMVMKRLPALGGDGGLIAVDKNGNIAMPFCTEGMYRGYIKNDGTKSIKIYKED